MRRAPFLALPFAAIISLVPISGRTADLEARPTIGVGGFFNMVAGFTVAEDKDALEGGRDRPVFDINPNAEIFFDGRARLDNGMSFRAHIELEGNTDDDQIDEAYVIIRGGFGQITIGAENGAAEMMTAGYGANSARVGTHYYIDGTNFLRREGWATPTSTVGVSHFWSDEDDEKIAYYTPRFLGFQFGASYTPVFDGDDNFDGSISDNYHDGFSFGVNFDRNFGGVGIGVAVGLLTKGRPHMASFETSDWGEYGATARLDYGPFRVAGGFRAVVDGYNMGLSHEGRIVDIGVRYIMGSNALSLVHVQGSMQGSTANGADNEARYTTFSFGRALGPGVKGHLNVTQADWKGEDPSRLDDNGGWALLAGLDVGF